MLNDQMRRRIRLARQQIVATEGPTVRRGEEIFSGTDYPRTWADFVGQPGARAYLQATIASAQARGARLDHVLLASGMPGVGKTSLAKLIASEMKVGIVELSGQVGVDEARTALRGMDDGDVLFYDEIHLAMAGGGAKAGWLLHLLQDGGLMTPAGFEKMPAVTVVAATTDAQRLPATILGRFMIRPVLEGYTPAESLEITQHLAHRMNLSPMPDVADLRVVARASNNSPREMRGLLVALRDSYFAGEPGYDIDVALSWAGVTRDGLSRLAQDFMVVLLVMCEGKASLATVAGLLNEPGPLGHTEQLLQQAGYLTIEPGGRALTEAGITRTVQLLDERELTR